MPERPSRRGRDGWRVTVCAWSGRDGGRVPASVFEELGEVVDGAEELDLGVDGVVAAVVDVAAEPGEQLGEGGLDEAGAALVQLLASRAAIFSQPAGTARPPAARPVWLASPVVATSSIRCSRAWKFAVEA